MSYNPASMTVSSDYSVRRMSQEEISSIAVDWAGKEGWNPGLHDADCFYIIDPNGFFVGVLNGEPISCVSGVAYDDKFAFIGFYITKSEYRAQGYGIQVWNTAIDYLKTQNIGLDGVVEQQENYKKSGFKFAYNNARYELKSKKIDIKDSSIIPDSSLPFDQLYEYDKPFFPADRKEFLKSWVSQPESTTLVKTDNSKILGYGMIRKCRSGYKIGPLFADDFSSANELLQSLVNSVEESVPIFLDIPETNTLAVELVNKYSMKKGFSTARMYTKESPKLPIDKIFGVTTFEVG